MAMPANAPAATSITPHVLPDLLAHVVAAGGSDLHLTSDRHPLMRVNGALQPVPHPSAVTADMVTHDLHAALPPDAMQRLHTNGETDCSVTLPQVGRFRVNAFRFLGSYAAVFRVVQPQPTPLPDLALPPVLQSIADHHRGLILVTGPIGSGKTTTLAGIIHHINITREAHIITIEDPVEVLHPNHRASVHQREILSDTTTWASALRAALRQDADVIMIGEIRDSETAHIALQAAETGQLVLATMHTRDATETINRFLDLIPDNSRTQARMTLAAAVQGIICQRLLPRTDHGRVVAAEIMTRTDRITAAIADPTTSDPLHTIINDSTYYGMQTFDQHLIELTLNRTITPNVAVSAATQPHDLALALRQTGVQLS